jgi:hypothetical protein
MKSMLFIALIAGSAHATIIDNGQFGANIGQVGGAAGSNAYSQSFTAPDDARLVKYGMWLQGGGIDPPLVHIDLWADDGSGNPDANNILIKGVEIGSVVDELTRFDTETDFMLTPGQTYHIVINGFDDLLALGNYNSTWDGGADTIEGGTGKFTNSLGSLWFDLGGDFGIYIETAGEDCYADCDASGGLDLFDFLCFTNDFNALGEYSDCDENGAYELFDFLCFVNTFNEGC